MRFGLIGNPLGHSFSKTFFTEKFSEQEDTYENFEIERSELKDFLQNTDLDGFNVTTPYKVDILLYLEKLTDNAVQVGAVNTVKRTSNGWVGENTDVYGFLKTLEKYPYHGKRMLVLGTGGASRAVIQACKLLSIPHTIVSRQNMVGTITYSDITSEIVDTHKFIVNTTPLGMSPRIETYPSLPYVALSENHICIDLVYNPDETLFMKKCKKQGAIVQNGLEMLHAQAEEAYRFWTNTDL